MLRRFVLISLISLIVLPSLTLTAQTDQGFTRADLTLHAGPGLHYPVVGAILADVRTNVEGRSADYQWVLLSAGVGAYGWAASGLVSLPDDMTLLDLPLLDVMLDAWPEAARAQTMADFTDDPDLLALIERLQATPTLHNMITDEVRAIFEAGQALGNRADVFTRVGDSDTTSADFLRPIGIQRGRYCDLGTYNYLQPAVEFFSVSPLPGVPNSFDNVSIAAVNGLTMVAAMDPLWAASPACASGESPLACEYRLMRPSVAIIMLGRMDVIYFDTEYFRRTARRVIEASIERGVIPVLTTFVVLPDNHAWVNSLHFNNVLVDLSDEYGIPLINLWAAVQALPGFGIGPDFTHLSHALNEFCTFTGSELRLGGTLRNLLTLQALEELRRDVLVAEG